MRENSFHSGLNLEDRFIRIKLKKKQKKHTSYYVRLPLQRASNPTVGKTIFFHWPDRSKTL